MRIDVHNLQQQPLFPVQVSDVDPPTVVRPPDGDGPEVLLNWEQARDDQGHLRRCPVCGCREHFVRKDFPQVTGFVLVVLAVVISMVLYGFRQVIWAVSVLAVMLILDGLIVFCTGKCLVCYRCRSEFRDLPISKRHPKWELAIGEKYRIVPEADDLRSTEDIQSAASAAREPEKAESI